MIASMHVCNRDMQTQMCYARVQVRPLLQISFAPFQVRRSGARAVIFSDGSGMLKAEGLAQSILVSHVRSGNLDAERELYIDTYTRICSSYSGSDELNPATFLGLLLNRNAA